MIACGLASAPAAKSSGSTARRASRRDIFGASGTCPAAHGSRPGRADTAHMSPAENTRLMRLSGELDVVLAREIAGELSQAVGDITQVPVVDLREVTFMDSMALAALAHAGEKLRNQGRTLALVIAPGPVESLIHESGLA